MSRSAWLAAISSRSPASPSSACRSAPSWQSLRRNWLACCWDRNGQPPACHLAILSVGLIFHLNQQVIGSIAAATGAVYQTAWRHAILAVAVLIGALIGQIWGLVGVAVGVFVALMFNYLQMSRLASSLTGLDLSAMLRAHVPGALLMLAVAGAALMTRGVMVSFDLASLAVLLACVAAAGLAAIASVRLWPNRLLGA